MSHPENVQAQKSPPQRSVLKSGRTKVKKSRGYCVKIDFTPLSEELHLKVSFDLFNEFHMVEKRKMMRHIFTNNTCNQGDEDFHSKYEKLECIELENESGFVRQNLTIKIFIDQNEYTEAIFEVYRGSKLQLHSIDFADCSLEPKLRGKSGQDAHETAFLDNFSRFSLKFALTWSCCSQL